MYGGGGRGGGGARNSGAVNVVGKALADAGGKLLINNLHTSVTQQDVKARGVCACVCGAPRASRARGGCGKGGAVRARCGREGHACGVWRGVALAPRCAASAHAPARVPTCSAHARSLTRSRLRSLSLCARVFSNANPRHLSRFCECVINRSCLLWLASSSAPPSTSTAPAAPRAPRRLCLRAGTPRRYTHTHNTHACAHTNTLASHKPPSLADSSSAPFLSSPFPLRAGRMP
jgi:hypothetical protein